MVYRAALASGPGQFEISYCVTRYATSDSCRKCQISTMTLPNPSPRAAAALPINQSRDGIAGKSNILRFAEGGRGGGETTMPTSSPTSLARLKEHKADMIFWSDIDITTSL